MKKFDFNGSAPSRSRITLIGPGGREVGETTADASGNWRIYGVEFGPGRHTCHASVRTPVGSLVCSEEIKIDAADSEQQPPDGVRQRAIALYEQTAESVAAGEHVDGHTINELCELTGQTMERFFADVEMLRGLAVEDARLANGY